MNSKLLLILVIVGATLLSGCTTKMNTYVHEKHPSEYLELYADQRYAVVQEDGFCGTWRIHGDDLHLYFNDALLIVMCPDDSGYVDGDGDLWVRK